MNTTKFAARVLSLLSLLIVVNVIAVSGEECDGVTGVTVYTECNYQGSGVCFPKTGNYSRSVMESSPYNVPQDTIKSVKVPACNSVRLWEHGRRNQQTNPNRPFDGKSIVLEEDTDLCTTETYWSTEISGLNVMNNPKTCSGVQGDPHFKTWNGELYDFHGVCDLVLLKNSEFENGLGMYMHIRTKRMRMWSYVSNAAIQIGKDSFEVMGGGEHKFWRNGVLGRKERLQNEGNEMIQISTLSGYPVYVDQVSDKSIQFVINLHREEKIEIGTWNSFVRINFDNTNSNHFEGSEGLMGSFPSGVKLARDKFTVMEGLDIFGQEWQVSQSEPKLFHNIEGPQYPTQCGIPSSSEMRRRLSKTSLSVETAKRACNDVHTDIIEMCVFDVLATSSVLTAGAY